MHIGPTRLLEDGAAIANYDSERRFCGGFWGLDLDDNKKIEEVVANAKNNKDKTKDPWKKNKRLKKKKIRNKRLSKAK